MEDEVVEGVGVQPQARAVHPGEIGALRLDEPQLGQAGAQKLPQIVQVAPQIGFALLQPLGAGFIGGLAGDDRHGVQLRVADAIPLRLEALPHGSIWNPDVGRL